MKMNARMLPRLNLCYLQKKAYEQHCRKLTTVKSTLDQTNRSNRPSIINQSRSNHRIQTLQQQRDVKLERSSRLNPHQKKVLYETQKENQRLFRTIKNCQPTISRKSINKHSIRSQQQLTRIVRFRTDPSSQRKVLKCKLSLEKIDSWQQRRASKTQSRVLPSCPTTSSKSRIGYSQLKGDGPQRKGRQFFSEGMNQKQRIVKSTNRNLEKVRRHFEERQFSLIAEERLKGFRQKSESSAGNMHSPQVHRWRTRCFTTQQQAYD